MKVKASPTVADLFPIAASTGAWLAASTVTVMVSSSVRAGLPLSVTTTRKDWLPAWAAVGVQLKAPVVGLMLAPAGTAPAGVLPVAGVPARL